VRVPVDTETGKWKVIGTLRAGETFGEVSLTVGAKSMASVITAEPCCFVEVKYDDCEGLLLSRSTTHLNTPQTWTISNSHQGARYLLIIQAVSSWVSFLLQAGCDGLHAPHQAHPS
jgi:CRP-like cAMP-binding protein